MIENNALQSDDEDSCFLARSAESSEEFKFTGDDEAKGEKTTIRFAFIITEKVAIKN